MKPRPVSMMLPRQGTFGHDDLPKKAAEAPEPRRPELEPSVSRLSVPSRPKLSRSKTPDFSLPPNDDTRSIFTKGVYSDAPKVKSRLYNMGQPLFTDTHQRLVDSLRDECARLHGFNQHLKGRISEAQGKAQLTERQLQDAKGDLQELRGQNQQLMGEIAALSANLQQATEALGEVDSVFADIRKKRLNRMSMPGIDSRLMLGEVVEHPERPKSPTPGASGILIDD